MNPKKKVRERHKPRTVCLSLNELERVNHAIDLEPGAPSFSAWAREIIMIATDRAIQQGRPARKVL
jgi:hypothetical protein